MAISCRSDRLAVTESTALPPMHRDDVQPRLRIQPGKQELSQHVGVTAHIHSNSNATVNAACNVDTVAALSEFRSLCPVVLYTNANHLLNKMDDLTCLVNTHTADVIAITETWLESEIPDTLCCLDNYLVYRKDRTSGLGGGVLCYVKAEMQSSVRVPQVATLYPFEVLWLLIRPKVLPRPLSCMIIGVFYIPPWYGSEMRKSLKVYIISCIDYFRSAYSHPCFILCGDFNNFDTTLMCTIIEFKQLVKSPTRGSNILDKYFLTIVANIIMKH